MLDRPNIVLSRDALLDRARGQDVEIFDRAIDVTISRLRRKLGEGDPIRTIRSGGYMMTLVASPHDPQLQPIAAVLADIVADRRHADRVGGVNVVLIMAVPQPRLDFYSLRDIAETLGDPRAAPGALCRSATDRHDRAAPPTVNDEHMRTNPTISWELANR
jgi:hypothetical protein